MSIIAVKNKVWNFINGTLGWKTDRKIVVFESDDWGMIRMASKSAFNFFQKKGFPVDKCVYSSNDMLESNEDMEALFEILESVKDKNGNSAIFTANNIVANPDFKKIREGGFQEYFYEPFTETLKRYPNHDQVQNLYKKGMEAKIFHPQLHGREHLNVERWMRALQSKDVSTHLGFQQNMFSLIKDGEISSCRKEYLDALGGDEKNNNFSYIKIIDEGCHLFKSIHGFASQSFIAPCYTWSSSINLDLKRNGILFLQGGRVQKEPKASKKGFSKKYHYLGQQNQHGQYYMIRNASFEVCENPNKDWVDSCMKEIETAFKFKKPAIISSHRVNYIGGIHPANRSQSLKLLDFFLQKIIKTYPEVEFMSSDQLGQLMAEK